MKLKNLLGTLILFVLAIGFYSCDGISYEDPEKMSNSELIDQYEKASKKIYKDLEKGKEIDSKLQDQFTNIRHEIEIRDWNDKFSEEERTQLKKIYEEWESKARELYSNSKSGNPNNYDNDVDDDDEKSNRNASYDDDNENDWSMNYGSDDDNDDDNDDNDSDDY